MYPERLTNETAYPFEEGVYRDANAIEFEVVVKRAKSKEEMDEPVPKPSKDRRKAAVGGEGH